MMTILSTQPTTHTDVAAEVTRLASNSEFRTRNAESIKAFLRRRLRVIGDCFKHRLRSASPRAYAWLREAHNPWARLTGKIGRRQDWRVTSGPSASSLLRRRPMTTLTQVQPIRASCRRPRSAAPFRGAASGTACAAGDPSFPSVAYVPCGLKA